MALDSQGRLCRTSSTRARGGGPWRQQQAGEEGPREAPSGSPAEVGLAAVAVTAAGGGDGSGKADEEAGALAVLILVLLITARYY